MKPVRKRIESPFSANLRSVLDVNKLTFREAAKLSGVSAAVVHAWTQGGMPQDLKAVLRLSEATRVDFQWLLTGTPSRVVNGARRFFTVRCELLQEGESIWDRVVEKKFHFCASCGSDLTEGDCGCRKQENDSEK